MKNNTNNWLQIKVFAGLGGLLVGAVSVIVVINMLAHENHANQTLLSHVSQLEVQGQAIKRRASTYARLAPREFPAYFRDLKIFYPDFMQDLEAFEQQIMHITTVATALPRDSFHARDKTLLTSIHNLNSNWQQFKQGFLKQLGDDLKEPRLEWGADYVQENQALINSITGMLIVTIENVIQKQLAANKQLTNNAFISAGTLLVIGIVWFYLSVIRRITLTVKGCQRVAQGDFGYSLPTRGNDELSALAVAFNTLSARTRFVVTMLSKMHQQHNIETKIDSLYKQASGYLPIEWLGLWQLKPEDNSLRLMSMRSERSASNSMQQTLIKVTASDQQLISICAASSAVKYDNLAEVASQLPKTGLMREIIKMGLLNSVLMVPLKADQGWQGLLVCVAAEHDAYSDEQLTLMENLSPFIANGFALADNTRPLSAAEITAAHQEQAVTL
ncbi:MAG: HAMP domain-containing protein [Gammaproteobacteria bacterium]|nr:HAMP domain-containing protein [Gammaproteobacteria bacterium]